MSEDSNTLIDIAASVQKKLLANLGECSAIEHPVTKGDNTEKVWIELFRKYLPTRFRTDSAIVIDSKGKTSDQIDCVIFDAHFTPQIIPNEVSLYVPAEAVHAVFEVKPRVNKSYLKYAATKVESVRKLHRSSTGYTGDGESKTAKRKFFILGGLLATSIDWKKGFESECFSKALKEAQQIAHLDLIFVADTGYADMVKSQACSKNRNKNSSGKPKPVIGASGISYGLFRLLEELKQQGTVPAVDWSEYYVNLYKK